MTEPTTDRPEWGDVQLDALIDRATARINTPRSGKLAYRETDADLLVIRDLITALTATRAALDESSAQADREPSERLMVAPAIQAVRDVLNGLEDWEIQDRALEEIRSAVDDIPDCESATAIPHEEHGEPSDAERLSQDELAAISWCISYVATKGGFFQLARRDAPPVKFADLNSKIGKMHEQQDVRRG